MNVVILLNDQHAHHVLGCAGFPLLQTPAADALAADGIRFEQAVCAVTPCLPSRHAISHGLYAFQTGIYTNGHCMPLEAIPSVTMARAFKDSGHRTAA
ncbi:MAG: sulfatase-like hydrolase/transferase, partial [Verrucomicrobia bacterium]|nr:sulfatase-like hydrolase/transferase [Verrucomicrobiota bacterium]